ncbi:UNVERIFIED_CONTAM: Beta-amylase 2, chloroplastic [Sesamum calycinum]|uniref:Beta-amylase n=1 Tax=Sesamum calycinum TaxID=2727403 RepID=A0AAW2SZZ1_9LAMI
MCNSNRSRSPEHRQTLLLQIEECLVKSSAPSRSAVGGSGEKFAEQDGSLHGIASWNQQEIQERDFTNTPYVPVYVMLPVVMSFHECGGNVGDDVHIPLPQWVIEIEFEEFFRDGVITEIEIGLGPCGELRYPSYPAKHNWKYPGIGEFQCYDKYLMKSFEKTTEARVNQFWGNKLEGVLIDHGDQVLALANLAFAGTPIAAKLSGIHWWYKTASHAAELTAGFYNSANRDGYAPIALMLKKHKTTLNFTCVELRTLDQYEEFPEALADPEGLVWQVLNAAWDAGVHVASENALPCYDRQGFNKILQNAKPYGDPDKRHLSAFTYLRLSPDLMVEHNLMEF